MTSQPQSDEVVEYNFATSEEVAEAIEAKKALLEEMGVELQPYFDALAQEKRALSHLRGLQGFFSEKETRAARRPIIKASKDGCPTLYELMETQADGHFRDFVWITSTGIILTEVSVGFRTTSPTINYKKTKAWLSQNGLDGVGTSFTSSTGEVFISPYNWRHVRAAIDILGLPIPLQGHGRYPTGRFYHRNRKINTTRVRGCAPEVIKEVSGE